MLYILPTDTCYGLACALDNVKSYEKIYKIKKRSFDKPLAIMVKSFDWLRKNTSLSSEQVDFLERYERPFTILTHAPAIELFLQFEDENGEYLINKDVYHEVALRVVHNPIQKKLLSQVWPIWLTSANISDTWENYTLKEIEKDFGYYIENNMIEILSTKKPEAQVISSDIFRFIGESLECEYVRKN